MERLKSLESAAKELAVSSSRPPLIFQLPPAEVHEILWTNGARPPGWPQLPFINTATGKGDCLMAIVQNITLIRDWLGSNVCSKITLKLPSDEDADTYPYELVHPAAFPLYFPGKDLLPPGVPAPIPSVCVEFLEGADDLVSSKGLLQIRLSFAAWNPGIHGPDMVEAREVAVRIVEAGSAGSVGQSISL